MTSTARSGDSFEAGGASSPPTPATITVMLSRPPRSFASATNASAALSGRLELKITDRQRKGQPESAIKDWE